MKKLKIRKEGEPDWEFWLEERPDGSLSIRASQDKDCVYGVLTLSPDGVHLNEALPAHGGFPVALNSSGAVRTGYTI